MELLEVEKGKLAKLTVVFRRQLGGFLVLVNFLVGGKASLTVGCVASAMGTERGGEEMGIEMRNWI